MKQALATGQKLVFGGEICNLGAKKQRGEKGKTASHAHKAQDRRLLDIQKKNYPCSFFASFHSSSISPRVISRRDFPCSFARSSTYEKRL